MSNTDSEYSIWFKYIQRVNYYLSEGRHDRLFRWLEDVKSEYEAQQELNHKQFMELGRLEEIIVSTKQSEEE